MAFVICIYATNNFIKLFLYHFIWQYQLLKQQCIQYCPIFPL